MGGGGGRICVKVNTDFGAFTETVRTEALTGSNERKFKRDFSFTRRTRDEPVNLQTAPVYGTYCSC